MTFRVEHDVPVEVKPRGRKPTYFPFDRMNVGDSFLIECDSRNKTEVENWRRKLSVSKKRYLLELDEQDDVPNFKTGCVARGLRVWRVK